MNTKRDKARPSTEDAERARAIMSGFVDDEYLATQLGLEDAIANALATRARDAEEATWKRSVEIVKTLTCDESYSGHWKCGFSMAQTEAIEALETAVKKVEESE